VSIQADIRVMYLNILGRPADPDGLNAYVKAWNNALGRAQGSSNLKTRQEQEDYAYNEVATSLKSSGEYRNRDNVIRNAYRTFLGREPSNEEVAAKSKESGNTSQVVKGIRDSVEATDFKNALTRDYLGAYSEINKYANQNAFSYNQSRFGNFKGGAAYLGALDHWNRYGKNENRVIPRTNLLVIDPKTKQLTLVDRKYFSNKAWNNYQNIIKRFQQSSGGDYKSLLETSINSLDSVAKNNLINSGG
jgi:hypothetical protein